MRKNIFFLIVLILVGRFSLAQSIDVDNPSQLYKPRVRTDFKYFSTFKTTYKQMRYASGNTLVTFPIRTKVTSNLLEQIKSGIKLRDLSDKVKIRFSQQMVTARFGYRNMNLGYNPNHNYYNASLGLFGVRSLAKFNVLFYSFNGNFSENSETLQKMIPGASIYIGNLKIYSLNKYVLYGAYAGYFNKKIFPIPFFGAQIPINKTSNLNFVLPAYVSYTLYKKNEIFNTTVGIDGFRAGQYDYSVLSNFAYGNIALSQSWKHQISRGAFIRCEAAYVSPSLVQLHNTMLKLNYTTSFGWYFAAGFNYNFGRPVTKQINLLDLL